MYVALEGIDTAGKSTQITRLKSIFKDAIFTFEPGATPLGASIRAMLLEHTILNPKAEMLLFLADRAEHFARVLAPNLGKLIISDRSLISGIAYAKDFDFKLLESYNAFVLEDTKPNKAVLLELDAKTLQLRLEEKCKDRIEQRGVTYLLALQERLRQVIALLKIEALCIDASLPQDEIAAKIVEFIQS